MGLLQYGSMDRRFFHRLGASLLDRTICAAAGKAGWAATIGASVGMDVEQFENSRLILIWGSNPVTSNLHFWTRAQEAKRRGAKLIAIDPYRSATAEKCHEHIALLPGTDAALALGMMHVLIAEDLLDHDYIDALHGRLRRACASAPPSGRRSARRATCGIDAARSWRSRATTARRKPAAIRVNYGMQRVRRRRQRRARDRLPAGAGRRLARSRGRRAAVVVGHLSRSIIAALERPDLIRGAPRTINMTAIGDALLDARDPPVRAIYVYNSNPVAVAPESGKVRAGFAREDLFCVVHEIFQTDTADFADILLPATTQLEQLDVHTSYGHLYALANNPAIAPLGEAMPNTEVFRRLAARMGFTEPCFRDTRRGHGAAGVATRRSARARDLDWDALKRDGWQRLNVPAGVRAVRARQLPDAVGQVRVLSATLAAQGQDPLPDYIAAARIGGAQPGAGAALSAGVHLAAGAQFPQFVVRQPAGVRRRGRHAEARSPSATMPRARGIATGDRVRIFNDRGSFTATARVGDARAARRGGGAVGLVAEAVAGRPQRERGDVAGADRSRPRRDVLRLPGRGRACVTRPQTAASVERWPRSSTPPRAPHERLPLLLDMADGVSSIDARRALDARAGSATRSPRRSSDARPGRSALPAGPLRGPAARPRDRARRVRRSAARASRPRSDDGAVAKTLRAISFVHDTLGDFPRALDYQFRALEIDERTGNDSSRAATLRTIGIVYSRSGDPARASISIGEASRCARGRTTRSSAARRSTTSAST